MLVPDELETRLGDWEASAELSAARLPPFPFEREAATLLLAALRGAGW